ncbi:ATP-dependent DNA helicase Q4 isoform X2 [Amia ocellicauda]|uniref:ATP-dependent DNA helicase Q4 isoform X2 n=1 Tax=Amia ocellicauda TaxID=2972642 RepID=UPI00346483F5
MDRYNDLKVLLKSWEYSFVQENKRKPNKDDIENAPEETKKLYKEYRVLKQERENATVDRTGNENSGKECQDQSTKVQTAEKEADCWGAHLNRKNMPVSVPKLTPKDNEALQASAQYFGMKLKSNLGGSIKDRPVSLKKSFTPKRQPLKSWKEGLGPTVPTDTMSPLPKPANTSPNACNTSAQAMDLEEGQEPFETIPGFTPSKMFSPVACTPERFTKKAQHLQKSVVKRLSSVDKGWLERCQVFDELQNTEKPATGNLSLADREGPLLLHGANKNMVHTNPLVKPANQNTALMGESISMVTQSRLPLEERLQITNGISAVEKAGSAPDGQVSTSMNSVNGKNETIRSTEKGGAERGSVPVTMASKSSTKAKERHVSEKEVADLSSNQDGNSETLSNRKNTRKRVRKRQRESDAEGDEPAESLEEGAAKKRRKTKKVSSEKPKASRVKKKAKLSEGGNNSTEEIGGLEEKKPKPKIQTENLLGDVDLEDIKAISARVQGTGKVRPSKNKDGNFVKINLKKKSHVKGYALKGASLRKELYMKKFQLKGERFGGAGRGGGGGGGGGRWGRPGHSGDTCFKCGGTGHWARDCKGRAPAPVVERESGEEDGQEEAFELPTLEEVARATSTLRSDPIVPSSCSQEGEAPAKEEDDILMNVIRPDYEKPAPPSPMEPLYSLTEDGKVKDVPPEVYEALNDFGYKSFRPGQEVAIMRILSGLSTLVVLSTGMGKSLCYQLPAYLYAQRSNSIALVVSPLVSLMDDQLSGLPPKLKAACIHSNMSKKQREAAIEKVKAGEVHVLLLSPEALVGGGHAGSGCLPPADQLPPVAFACIDEAHCVSEWSHNFRPCYLRLCKVLRDRLGVRCLLGLTATATMATALDIANHLDISDAEGIAVRSAAVPHNLQLSVSLDREKDQALVNLLKGERFGSLDSVIVYCTRREETTRIAALLRTCMQGVMLRESAKPPSLETEENTHGKRKKALAKKKIRKPLKWIAESYHAGLSASQRRRVQNNFMCGELRIVVATVAFGMGLDKSDVRGIIHYNMPKSFESYVQEIGRAGRDGEPAHCHLFLNPEGGDLHELRRHIFADTVDYFTVKRLVKKAFPPCKCRQIHQKQQDLLMMGEVDDIEMMEAMDASEKEQQPEQQQPEEQRQEEQQQPEEQRQEEQPTTQSKEREVVSRVCHTHERAIPIQETVEALDITEEGIETLLCYLELHPQQWVELLHPTLSTCRLVCYNGPQQLRGLAKICPPVAVALARMRMAGVSLEHCSSVDFDVVELADAMGWELLPVKRGLRQLQWYTQSAPLGYRGTGKSGVLVEFSDLSFHFRSYGDLTPDELDGVCEFLHQRVLAQERTQLYQLKACFNAFQSVAYRNCTSCTDEMDEERSLKLKELLKDYFDKKLDLDLSKKYQEDKENDEEDELTTSKLQDWENQIRADIRSFLSCHMDEKFSGRAVARIFHGIGSPCYPAQIYGRDRRYWRKYIQFDFNEIIRMATEEIIRTK